MYRIGAFSKITSLTVKALRYYDEQGLLRPSARDESGYRLYSEEDYQTARRIALLRRFGFSIAELRDVLRGSGSDDELAVYLQEKRSLLEREVRRKQAQIDVLEKALASFSQQKGEDKAMEPEQKTLPALWVLSARFCGAYPEVGAHIGACLLYTSKPAARDSGPCRHACRQGPTRPGQRFSGEEGRPGCKRAVPPRAFSVFEAPQKLSRS